MERSGQSLVLEKKAFFKLVRFCNRESRLAPGWGENPSRPMTYGNRGHCGFQCPEPLLWLRSSETASPLFRQADLARDGPGRLRQDALVGRPAAAAHAAAAHGAAAHGAAAAVEQAQAQAVFALDAGRGNFGFVEFPARREETAVLFAVGGARHDLLFVLRLA